ncbi:MAG: GH3 family domain-containing protein, partial [Owenweeksia sp.]
MHILGGVIKQAINLKHGIEDSTQGSPIEKQNDQLKNLLRKAKNTAFGKFYDFEGILASGNVHEEYRKRVPIHDYDKMHDNWWHQQLRYPDITWPGKPGYFARSSGTTGSEPKRIPVTDEMIDSIRSVGVAQLTSIANFDLPPEFFEKQILMLGSSTELAQVDDHEEGEISGISASNIPGWFDSVYKPGHEISAISDWDERVARIAKEAPNWDIGAASGIPSWLLLLFKEILKVNKVDSIHDIWPDFKVYTTGGVAFEPYRMAFDELFREEVIYMDTYLASEGFFAYNARPETRAMHLAVQNGIYYEFVPFDERGFDGEGNILDDPEVH